MFARLHDNMRNARDSNQALNRSLSIFLCVSFLQSMMQRFCDVFVIACATGALSSKQNGSIQVKAQFELH